MHNPFEPVRDGRTLHTPCVTIIFGATGDLTKRKLVPALYNLAVDGLLPPRFSLISFARRDYSSEAFREELRSSVASFSRRKPLREDVWTEFSSRFHYCQGNFDEDQAFVRLAQIIKQMEEEAGGPLNRVFYFATAPDFFEVIARKLSEHNLLTTSPQGGEARVVVEKPFGHDLDSARALNFSLLQSMEERQIFRIDHYLGKETVQNLLIFRFANGIFEPIWNHKYIHHIEISVCESLGVEGRAGFFDQAGVLRDIVQNHVLQLLCLVALEPPVAFEADAVRDEKVKVLRSLRPLSADCLSSKVVRARYSTGSVAGQTVPGYLQEPGVKDGSTTETFFAMQVAIDNWRWAGVPIFLRAGKRLAKRVTDISIFFRQVPFGLFSNHVEQVAENVLSFQIQPDEGIALKFVAKPPGSRVRIQPVNMEFSYGSSFGVEAPDAYERLLLDAMKGDATLFTRKDEIEAAWSYVSPIIDSWKEPGAGAPVSSYDAGSWGPYEAERLLFEGAGKGWRRL